MEASCTKAVKEKVTKFMVSSQKFWKKYEASRARLQKQGYIDEQEIAHFKEDSSLM